MAKPPDHLVRNERARCRQISRPARVRAAVIFVLLATTGLAGCGGGDSGTSKPSGDAAPSAKPAKRSTPSPRAIEDWTCKDFKIATAADRQDFIAILAYDSGLDAHQGALRREVASLCRGRSPDYKPAAAAAQNVAAANLPVETAPPEEPAPGDEQLGGSSPGPSPGGSGGGGGGGTGESGAGGSGGGTRCNEEGVPGNFAPGCQGQEVPSPGSGQPPPSSGAP